MASTNLSNSIIGTITISHIESLGLKLVFYGINDFSLFFFHFNVLMKIHGYANWIPSITYHRIKGLCLSLKMEPSSMV